MRRFVIFVMLAAALAVGAARAQDSSGVSVAGSYNLYGPRSIAVSGDYAFVGGYGFTTLEIADREDISENVRPVRTRGGHAV